MRNQNRVASRGLGGPLAGGGGPTAAGKVQPLAGVGLNASGGGPTCRRAGGNEVDGTKDGRFASIVLQIFVISTPSGIGFLFPMTCIF